MSGLPLSFANTSALEQGANSNIGGVNMNGNGVLIGNPFASVSGNNLGNLPSIAGGLTLPNSFTLIVVAFGVLAIVWIATRRK
jgi:hypothetical protein